MVEEVDGGRSRSASQDARVSVSFRFASDPTSGAPARMERTATVERKHGSEEDDNQSPSQLAQPRLLPDSQLLLRVKRLGFQKLSLLSRLGLRSASGTSDKYSDEVLTFASASTPC